MRVALALAVLVLAPTALAESAPSREAAEVVARALGEAVAAQDAEAAASLCAAPTNLDGRLAETDEAVVEAFREALSQSALRGVHLVSVEVMPLATATARFGPPPRRLGALPEDTLVAVLRLDRAQLVAVLAPRGGRWAVVAVTD